MKETLQDYKGTGLWIDGDLHLEGSVKYLYNVIQQNEVWAGYEASHISNTNLSVNWLQCLDEISKPLCDSSRVGIKYASYAYYTIFTPWFECATIRDCIVPLDIKSEQAALSCLIHHSGIQDMCSSRDSSGSEIKRDTKWRESLQKFQQIFQGDNSSWPIPPE